MIQDNNIQHYLLKAKTSKAAFFSQKPKTRALLEKEKKRWKKESKVVGGTLAPLPKSVIRRRPLHHPFNQRKKELFLGRLALDSTNIQAKYMFT